MNMAQGDARFSNLSKNNSAILPPNGRVMCCCCYFTLAEIKHHGFDCCRLTRICLSLKWRKAFIVIVNRAGQTRSNEFYSEYENAIWF